MNTLQSGVAEWMLIHGAPHGRLRSWQSYSRCERQRSDTACTIRKRWMLYLGPIHRAVECTPRATGIAKGYEGATSPQGARRQFVSVHVKVGFLVNERVTWLMPVKNGMPYLSETLASIEAQTYRDWEILVWDNGSTDGTLDELRRWIPSRLPGRIIDNRPLSLGNSLAALVEAAGTELCARIDADDVNYPERLERQVAFL